MTQKNRRKTGWTYPKCVVPIKTLKENDLVIEPYWDDWNDWRDGFRNCPDNKKIRSKHMCCAEAYDVERYNKKNKKLVQRRRIMKHKMSDVA